MSQPRLTWETVEQAVQRARQAHEAASAEARDRLLRLPEAERLQAVANPCTWGELTPEHQREVLGSLAAALARAGQGAIRGAEPPAGEAERQEQYRRELAAWRARDAAEQAAKRRY